MARECGLNVAARTALVLLVTLMAQTAAHAQGPGAPDQTAPTARAAAPIDLTGYWESVVTLDWAFRMVTPRPGDYENVPLSAAGIRTMQAWDPAKDTTAGEQCRSYGAPAIMRVPEHVHITWQDDQTMKLETDAGEQIRLFHFAKAAAGPGPRTWQGYSAAEWDFRRASIDTGGGRVSRPGAVVGGDLKVSTSNLKAGYLRKNGIPYSENAQLLEYYDLIREGNADRLLNVTSIVTDPVYLTRQFIVDSTFRERPDATGWNPSACSAIW